MLLWRRSFLFLYDFDTAIVRVGAYRLNILFGGWIPARYFCVAVVKYRVTILRLLLIASQRLMVVLLLFTLMLQCFSKMIVVAGFYANRDYIARNLCINRLNTAVRCGGRCQLDKRILAENKSNGDTEHKSDSRFEVLSSKSFYLTSFFLFQPRVSRSYPVIAADGPVDQPAVIFHPPAWLLVS